MKGNIWQTRMVGSSETMVMDGKPSLILFSTKGLA